MSKKLNLENEIGKVYGYWEILEDISYRRKSYVKAKCLKCGTIKEVYYYNLKSGKSSMCVNCANKIIAQNLAEDPENFIGKTFGYWLVLSDEGRDKSGKHRLVKARCLKCNREFIVILDKIKRKNDHNMCIDCAAKENGIKLRANPEDLIGEMNGLQKIIYVYPNTQDWGTLVDTQCILCGAIKYKVRLSNFRKKERIYSCECQTQSILVSKIKNVLDENNIKYTTEKRFEDCKDKKPLPFDFYIDNKYIIEADGLQHFRPSNWAGEEGLRYIQEHDRIKNEYCRDNDIPIIRIPYSCKNPKLEDIIPDTSKYLIK